MATEVAFWILLNFFVLEMQAVKYLIEARGRQDFEIKMAFNKKLRNIILPIQVLFQLIFRFIVCLAIYKLESYIENKGTYGIISVIFRSLYIFVQLGFIYLWFTLLNYFTQALTFEKTSTKTLVIFIWILSFLLICDHLALIISGAIEIYAPTK